MTEILSDILQNSLLSSSAIEVERGVILREMAEVASQPDEVRVSALTMSALTAPTYPLRTVGV